MRRGAPQPNNLPCQQKGSPSTVENLRRNLKIMRPILKVPREILLIRQAGPQQSTHLEFSFSTEYSLVHPEFLKEAELSPSLAGFVFPG